MANVFSRGVKTCPPGPGCQNRFDDFVTPNPDKNRYLAEKALHHAGVNWQNIQKFGHAVYDRPQNDQKHESDD